MTIAIPRLDRTTAAERGLTLADFLVPISVGERLNPRLRHMVLIATGAFLTNEPGALAAHSLAAFVGSGFSSRIAFVRALNGQITLGLRDGLEIKLGAPIDLRLKVAIARGILPLLAFPAAGGPDYLDITVPERPVAGRNPQPSG